MCGFGLLFVKECSNFVWKFLTEMILDMSLCLLMYICDLSGGTVVGGTLIYLVEAILLEAWFYELLDCNVELWGS